MALSVQPHIEDDRQTNKGWCQHSQVMKYHFSDHTHTHTSEANYTQT